MLQRQCRSFYYTNNVGGAPIEVEASVNWSQVSQFGRVPVKHTSVLLVFELFLTIEDAVQLVVCPQFSSLIMELMSEPRNPGFPTSLRIPTLSLAA